jgi:hypothetical protein
LFCSFGEDGIEATLSAGLVKVKAKIDTVAVDLAAH